MNGYEWFGIMTVIFIITIIIVALCMWAVAYLCSIVGIWFAYALAGLIIIYAIRSFRRQRVKAI